MTKKHNISDVQTDPVFTYICSEIGESRDIYRFDIERDDLSKASIAFNQFKGSRKHFSTQDKRCKVFSVEKFKVMVDRSWIIDGWWKNKEKVELGIENKRNTITMFEFSSMLGDFADTANSFQEEMSDLLQADKITTYKSFCLKDLFDVVRGKPKYTRIYGKKNEGEHPVFSASNSAPLAHIKTFDFDGEYLTWSTNGFAGYMKIISGKFSINGDRAILKDKVKNLNLKYIKHVLEPILRNLAKGRKGDHGQAEFTKVYPSMLSDIQISLPVTRGGDIDLFAQEEIAKKIDMMEEAQSKVLTYQKKLEESSIAIDLCDITEGYKKVNILDKKYFEIVQGSLGMKRTEYAKFDSKNNNDIPVYTAKLDPVAFFPVNSIKKAPQSASIQLPHISFANDRDGTAGTNIVLHTNRYYINTSRFVFKVVDRNISPDFIFFSLQNIKQKYGFNYAHKATRHNIGKIYISIPILSTGKFDLAKQREIVERFLKIEEIKSNMEAELKKIADTKVDLFV